MFPSKKYNEVLVAIHNVDEDEVEKFYLKYSKEVVTLLCLPDPSKGLMIKVFLSKQFDKKFVKFEASTVPFVGQRRFDLRPCS